MSNPELGVYGYFVKPGGVIWRYAIGATLPVEAATWQFAAEDALRQFFGPQRFYFVHDFSTPAGYTPEFRKALTERGQYLKKEILHSVLIPSKQHPIIGFGISAAMMALRLFGVPIELADDLDQAIAKHKLRPAPPTKAELLSS